MIACCGVFANLVLYVLSKFLRIQYNVHMVTQQKCLLSHLWPSSREQFGGECICKSTFFCLKFIMSLICLLLSHMGH